MLLKAALFILSLFAVSPAYAQICFPNPNASPVGSNGVITFIDNCPMSALGLSLAFGAVQPGFTSADTAPYTTDGSKFHIASVNSPTANAIYRMSTNALVTDFDVIRSVGVDIAGSSVTNVAQFGAYQQNNNPLGSGATTGSGVLYFGVGVAAVNNAAEWGLNPVLTDNTSYAVSAGTGRFLQNELDFNVDSPSTIVNGMFCAGASLSIPTLSNCFRVRPLGTGIKWNNGFVTDNGAASNALAVGAAAVSGTNIASQFSIFNYFDASGVAQNYTLQANTGQQLELGSSIGAAATLLVDGLIKTPDSATFANAFQAGAQAASGTNIASQTYLWHYFNGSGTSLNAIAKVTTGQILAFTGASSYSVDQSFAAPLFVGNGINGVACTAGTVSTATMTVSGGIVTHC